MTIASLIVDVAANTVKLQKDVQQISGSLDHIKTVAGTVAKALTAAFSVTALIAAGRSVIAYADELVNLSQKTGISTDALQKLEAAFKDSGVSLDTVTTASIRLANNLVGGNKSTTAALRVLGLSVQDLIKMPIEQQFLAVADAIGRIPNPTEKAYATLQVFGKGGMGLLQGLSGTLTETTNRFEQMGLIIDEKTLKAADDFGDQLGVMGKQLIGVLAQGLAPMLPALSALANALGEVAKIVGPVLGMALKGVTEALGVLWAGIAKLVAKFIDMAQHVPLVGKHLDGLSAASDWLKKSASETWNGVTKMALGITNVGITAIASNRPLKGFAEHTEEAERQAKKLSETLNDIKKLESTPLLSAFTNDLRGLGTAIPQQFFDDVVKARTETLLLEAQSREPLRRFTNVLRDLGDVIPQDFFEDIAKVRSEVIKLESDTGASLDTIGKRFVPTIEDLNTVFSRTDKIVVSVSKSLEKLPNLLIAGFTGGGNIKGALSGLATDITSGLFGAKGPLGGATKAVGGALSGALGGALGSTMSGIIGSAVSGILPGIGALVAPLLGKIMSMFGPSKEQLAARDQQQQLIEQLNAVATATQKLEMAGVRGSSAYATLGVIGRDAMLAIGKSAAEADIVVQGLLDTEHPTRFASAMKQVQDAMKLQTEAQQALSDALGRYKFSIEELGPALSAQRLSEQSQQLYKDWQVLTQAGVDTVAVAREMSTSVNQYIQTAVKMGAEVPAAMRPMIQAMIDQGLLTDASGAKITSLEDSGVSFAQTMTEGFQSIVESVRTLTDVLRRGLGLAVDDVASKIANIPREISVEVEGRVNWSTGDMPEAPGYQHGGVVLPFRARGTDRVPAMLTPGELVLTASQQRSLLRERSDNQAVRDELSALRREMADRDRILPKAIRDAVLLAG